MKARGTARADGGILRKAKIAEKNKDILLLPTFDWHVGSTMGVHPNYINVGGRYISVTSAGGWHYKDSPNFYPSSLQVGIFDHVAKSLDVIAARRKGKKLVTVFGGDLIDGDHHNTHQLVTQERYEQVNTAIELIKWMNTRLQYTHGDMMAFVYGTTAHVENNEEEIARQAGGYQYPNGDYCTPHLTLELNGVVFWLYHKGVSAGQGATRGNACVNKMRQVYFQSLMTGSPCPDWIITGHTHDYYHATWTTPSGKTMHYVISPPLQDKTRFATDNLATSRNAVGLFTITVTAGGIATIQEPDLLVSPLGDTIRLGAVA